MVIVTLFFHGLLKSCVNYVVLIAEAFRRGSVIIARLLVINDGQSSLWVYLHDYLSTIVTAPLTMIGHRLRFIEHLFKKAGMRQPLDLLPTLQAGSLKALNSLFRTWSEILKGA